MCEVDLQCVESVGGEREREREANVELKFQDSKLTGELKAT